MLPRQFYLPDALRDEIIAKIKTKPVQLMQTLDGRNALTQARLAVAESEGYIKKLPDSKYNVENTVKHNFENLDPNIAHSRPWALLGPLTGIDRIAYNIGDLKVLIVGPRTEAEIIWYLSTGFRQPNIYGLDLITYSEFITQGDMHDMPFEENFFDVVLFSWVLGYSTNQKLAVKEGIRVLKPSGIIGIGEQWYPKPISEVPKELKQPFGYSLEGTVTSSVKGLISLLDKNLSKVIFSTEPIKSQRDRIGWITCIVEIKK